MLNKCDNETDQKLLSFWPLEVITLNFYLEYLIDPNKSYYLWALNGALKKDQKLKVFGKIMLSVWQGIL